MGATGAEMTFHDEHDGAVPPNAFFTTVASTFLPDFSAAKWVASG